MTYIRRTYYNGKNDCKLKKYILQISKQETGQSVVTNYD